MRALVGPIPPTGNCYTIKSPLNALNGQPNEVYEAACAVLPDIHKGLQLVKRPCLRLTLLLRSYGIDFKADAQQPLAMCLLAVCISCRVMGLPCTVTEPMA